MCSYFCSLFGTASYLFVSEKVLSLGEGLATSAFRHDTSQPVAYGNRSQPSVYLYEGDKLCAKSILSGPAADPFGKDIIALYWSQSVTKKLSEFSGLGAANLGPAQ